MLYQKEPLVVSVDQPHVLQESLLEVELLVVPAHRTGPRVFDVRPLVLVQRPLRTKLLCAHTARKLLRQDANVSVLAKDRDVREGLAAEHTLVADGGFSVDTLFCGVFFMDTLVCVFPVDTLVAR